MMDLNYRLYISDVDEKQIVEWLCENISPVVFTTKAEFAYYEMYHGDHDLWILDTSDVSDVSLTADTVTQVCFKKKEDRMLCQLAWGGSCG